MIHWCGECHRFLGERKPFEDFTLSRVTCPVCEKNGVGTTGEHAALNMAMDELFGTLNAGIPQGKSEALKECVDNATTLGIRPSDLLMSLMRPYLHELAELYTKGQASAKQRNDFTAFVEHLMRLVGQKHDRRMAFVLDTCTDVLIVCVDGESHIEGARFVELALRRDGIAARAVYRSLPPHEIVALAGRVKPKVLGLCVATSKAIPAVADIGRLLRHLDIEDRPAIAVGGQAIAGIPEHGAFSWDVDEFQRIIRCALSERQGTVETVRVAVV